MKYFAILALLITSCSTSTVPFKTEVDTSGVPIRVTATIEADDYADMQISDNKADCQAGFFATDDKLTDSKDIIIAQAFKQQLVAAGVDPCPHILTNNETQLGKNSNMHGTIQKGLGIIPTVYGIQQIGKVGAAAVANRDPVIVPAAEPLIVNPVVVNPQVIQVPVIP